MNSIEYIIGNTLNSLDIIWEYEVDFNFNGLVYVPDFYIKKYNLVIECYGNYWHANPMFYSKDDLIFKDVLVE
jgi:G:T-mismatch repair DNA endonuclease (very short patch repair protein)